MESSGLTSVLASLENAYAQLLAKDTPGPSGEDWDSYRYEFDTLAQQLPSSRKVLARLASRSRLEGGSGILTTCAEQLSRVLEDYTQAIEPCFSPTPPPPGHPSLLKARALAVGNVNALLETLSPIGNGNQTSLVKFKAKVRRCRPRFLDAAAKCDQSWADCKVPDPDGQPSAEHATSDPSYLGGNDAVKVGLDKPTHLGTPADRLDKVPADSTSENVQEAAFASPKIESGTPSEISYSMVESDGGSSYEFIDSPTDHGHGQSSMEQPAAPLTSDQMQAATATESDTTPPRAATEALHDEDAMSSLVDIETETMQDDDSMTLGALETGVSRHGTLSVKLDKGFIIFVSANVAINQCIMDQDASAYTLFCIERISGGNDNHRQVMVLGEPCRDGRCEHTSVRGLGDSYLGPDGAARPQATFMNIRYPWETDYHRAMDSDFSQPVLVDRCARKCRHTLVEFVNEPPAMCMLPVHLMAVQEDEMRFIQPEEGVTPRWSKWLGQGEEGQEHNPENAQENNTGDSVFDSNAPGI